MNTWDFRNLGNGQFLNYCMSNFSHFKHLPSWELPYLIFVFQIFPGFLVDVLCFLDYVQSCGLEQLNPKTPRHLRTTYLFGMQFGSKLAIVPSDVLPCKNSLQDPMAFCLKCWYVTSRYCQGPEPVSPVLRHYWFWYWSNLCFPGQKQSSSWMRTAVMLGDLWTPNKVVSWSIFCPNW